MAVEINTQQPAVLAQALSKRYAPDVLAVDNLDLAVSAASIYALLGPNGAGKTTTIAMLTTLVQPTSGRAVVAGADVTTQPAQVRRSIGVTFQDIVLDADLTGRQVLDVHGQLYGQSKAERRSRTAELVRIVELEDAVDRLVKTYSGGMKRRLELARGLMTRPQVLFLDEPTQGLDPQNRTSLWTYIRQLRQQTGLTLLLTTHYMEEAEALADQVGILDHGRLVAAGTPEALVREMGADLISLRGSGNIQDFARQVRQLPFVERVTVSEDVVQIGVDSSNARLAAVVALGAQDGFHIEDVSLSKPSLADVFLKYTGRALRDK